MIRISLDEAYVFDLLSILDLKKTKSQNLLDAQKHIDNYNLLYQEIASQISSQKIEKIINSIEYKELLEINNKVFELVELGKQKEGLAKITVKANYERFILKNKLQEKFFINPLKETKIGYDKI